VPKRMTRQTQRLLEVMLGDPTREWYGLELMEAAALSSGTAYPMLHRLLKDSWLSSAQEQIDPRAEGRPRRRMYRLTGVGTVAAARAVEQSGNVPKGREPRASGRPSGAWT
jgi:PadR family transcriptional regulator PadR